MISDAQNFARIAAAAGICTGTIVFGLQSRRGDGSRRWPLAIAGLLATVPVTLVALGTTEIHTGDEATYLCIGLATLALAAVALTFGLRGRRVGDHPYCRRCGFDLFGKPAESTRCGECGAPLDEPSATVTGVHQRRGRLLAAALFLLLFGILSGGPSAWRLAKEVNWENHKPLWWLLRDLDDPARSRQAWIILRTEFANDELSAQQVDSIIRFGVQRVVSGKPFPMIQEVYQWTNSHDQLPEATIRLLIKEINQPIPLYSAPVACRNLPFRVVPLSGSDSRGHLRQGARDGPWTRTIDDQQFTLGGVAVPLPIKTTDPFGEDIMVIDPGPAWSKIADGPTTLARTATRTIQYRTGDHVITESQTWTSQRPITVATGVAAELATTSPTQSDLANSWSAELSTYAGEVRLSIMRTGPGSEAVTRIALVDTAGTLPLGNMEMSPRQSATGFPLPALPRLIQPPAAITLIPAPDLTRGQSITGPMLNQTIRIDGLRFDRDDPEVAKLIAPPTSKP